MYTCAVYNVRVCNLIFLSTLAKRLYKYIANGTTPTICQIGMAASYSSEYQSNPKFQWNPPPLRRDSVDAFQKYW